MFLTGALFLVPIKSLSSESFLLRSTNSNINFTEKEKSDIKVKFTNNIDTTSFRFFDWINAKSLNQNKLFKDKKFKGSGFVSKAANDNYFNLTRFVISCCVVDATPVSLLVEYDKKTNLKTDDWVEVSGTFALKDVNGSLQPVIIVSDLQKIPEPDSVYLERT